jgi:type I restriction enzyme M protein
MQWIAPTQKDPGTETPENRLWAAADQLRANSGLTSAQYSQPVLGLMFLRFAEVRFLAREPYWRSRPREVARLARR